MSKLIACVRRSAVRLSSDPESSASGDRLQAILQAKRADDLQVWRERRDDRSLYALHGVPRLRTSVVTYVDTLGTKARSSTLSNSDLRSDIEENDEYQERLHSRFWRDATQRMVTFSDNICVAAPVEGQEIEAIVRDQIDGVARFQLGRMLAGRPIRGGITVGDVYCDSNYVDGPALIRAVDLEEKVAKCPRVLIEDDAATEIRSRWAGRAEQWPYKLVALDDDGRLFVNYLHASGPFSSRVSGPISNPIEARSSRHRSVVAQQLALGYPSKVQRKWQWVARYHNWFVGEFLPGRSDLLVGRYRPQACSLL